MGQREEMEKRLDASMSELENARQRLEHEQWQLEDAIRQRRYELRQRLYAMFIAVGVILTVGAFFLNAKQTPPISAKEQLLQVEVSQLNDRINTLQASIDNASQQSNQALASQVQAVNGRVDNLSATILEDPDKALTARLLREKQANLEETVKELKAETVSTRQTFNSLLIAVIAAVFGVPLLWNGTAVVTDKLLKRDKKTLG